MSIFLIFQKKKNRYYGESNSKSSISQRVVALFGKRVERGLAVNSTSLLVHCKMGIDISFDVEVGWIRVETKDQLLAWLLPSCLFNIYEP